VVGKSSPSANGVLAVLPADGIHLEIELSEKGQLLVEKVILPGPRSQVAQSHPDETKGSELPPMLVKQSAHFSKEGLIHVQRAGHGMRAGMGDKVSVSELDRHRARLQRTLAQPSAHVFGKGDEGGLKESRIKDVLVEGVLPGDRFDLLSRSDGAYVFSPGPPGQCLSPLSQGELKSADRYPGEIPYRSYAPVTKLLKKSRAHPGQALDGKRSKKLRLHSTRNHGEAGRLPVVRGPLAINLLEASPTEMLRPSSSFTRFWMSRAVISGGPNRRSVPVRST
jgi:hypothetical protein